MIHKQIAFGIVAAVATMTLAGCGGGAASGGGMSAQEAQSFRQQEAARMKQPPTRPPGAPLTRKTPGGSGPIDRGRPGGAPTKAF